MAQAQHKRDFHDFAEQRGYHSAIRAMLASGQSRLLMNLDDLRSYNPETATNFMRQPADYLPAYEEAMREIITSIDPSLAKQGATSKYRIGITGSFGSHHVSPRGLGSALLNSVVRVEGIITKCSGIRPKVVMSKHWCPKTKAFTTKEYRDLTSLTGVATGSAYPTKDAEGNLLETEYGLSEYTDHQTVHVQEMPERAPPGQLPRSIEVVFEADLVDSAKPGDRLYVTGIHRALPGKANASGTFKTIILGNAVRLLTKHLGSSQFTEEDVKHIKEISRRSDTLALLSESLAPSVFGHAQEKRALLMMLLGGTERNLENGTHLRGDINILMLGDPSTAKSQLLRAVMRTAPLAISTTGRGSSGVGLTAAVTTDSETGCKRLEAGAMVLADRGVCCVDEFDKMIDADRVALHEVMEQQTVTIAKAGMHASLNARCSVVAAANPVYGSYDRNMTPMANIGMPDSLLSRFDLLFTILDKKDKESDTRIANHVLTMHCMPAAPHSLISSGGGHQGTRGGEHAGGAAEGVTSDVWMQKDSRRNVVGRGSDAEADEQQVTPEFMKKYIHYAKVKCTPQLSDEASSYIVNAYADLRRTVSQLASRTLPVTARTLETMIRLSSAHAKCHLRGLITAEDAKAAISMLEYALLSEDYASTHGKKAADDAKPEGGASGGGGAGGDDDDSSDGGDDGDGGNASAQPPEPRADRGRCSRGGAAGSGDAAGGPAEGGGGAAAGSSSGAELDQRTLDVAVAVTTALFGTGRKDSCSVQEFFEAMRTHKRTVTMEEVNLALAHLEGCNRLMRSMDRILHI